MIGLPLGGCESLPRYGHAHKNGWFASAGGAGARTGNRSPTVLRVSRQAR
jgi:hypothetical protein